MSLGSGINDLIDYSELIIDKKLLNFFDSKEDELNTGYEVKHGAICKNSFLLF